MLEIIQNPSDKIFGVSEFFSLFTILVIAWTLGDSAVKCRVLFSRIENTHRFGWAVVFLFAMSLLADLGRMVYIPIASHRLFEIASAALTFFATIYFLNSAFTSKPSLKNRNIKILIDQIDRAIHSNDKNLMHFLVGIVESWLDDINKISSDGSWFINQESIDGNLIFEVFFLLSSDFCIASITTSNSEFSKKFYNCNLHSDRKIYSTTILAAKILKNYLEQDDSPLMRELQGGLSYQPYRKPLTSCIFNIKKNAGANHILPMLGVNFFASHEKIELLGRILDHQLSMLSSIEDANEFARSCESVSSCAQYYTNQIFQLQSVCSVDFNQADWLVRVINGMTSYYHRISLKGSDAIVARKSYFQIVSALSLAHSYMVKIMILHASNSVEIDNMAYRIFEHFFPLRQNRIHQKLTITSIRNMSRFFAISHKMGRGDDLERLIYFFSAISEKNKRSLQSTLIPKILPLISKRIPNL